MAQEGACSPHDTTQRLTPAFGFVGVVGGVPVTPLYAACIDWAGLFPDPVPPAAVVLDPDEPPDELHAATVARASTAILMMANRVALRIMLSSCASTHTQPVPPAWT